MYEKTLRELVDELNRHTALYDMGKPEISDEEWDSMYFELVKREEIDGVIYPDSPTQKISFQTVSQLEKVKHNHLMLSLDKTKDPETVRHFLEKQHLNWLAMFKLDGLSCSLEYDEEGNLIGAETRGDGEVGENIFHNALVISSIPKKIPNKRRTVVDGEIICDWETFNNNFSDTYKNPRNFASGSIRQLNSAETAARKLTFIAWDLIEGIDEDMNYWRLEALDNWGFKTVPRVCDAETVSDAINILDELRLDDIYKNYPIDGYVFKFVSKKKGELLGRTEHHFCNAIAYKFYDEEYTSELLDIELSMGRTGILTPVAIFKPIEIDGTTVERASLHNVSIMKNLLGEYPAIGQKVFVLKSNMIIPQIARSIIDPFNNNLIFKREECVICPVCGKPLEVQVSDSGVENFVCVNDKCEGKLINRIEHFAGKKGLDIKGISKATIDKLIQWGWLKSLKDIFLLDNYKKEWINKDGFGEKSVSKILVSIENSRNCRLDKFISALGIPLVGNTIAKEIVKYFDTWEDFRAAVGGDWTEFDGFGLEISRSINTFNYAEADEIAEMLAFEQIEVQSNDTSAAAIKGKTFVVTGKLINYKNRDELKADIESFGGKVVGSISSKTDYLINNDINSTSSKNKKAKDLGIPIITEKEYLDLKK